MARDTFPFWGPGSPQDPHAIHNATVKALFADLPVSQVPRGRQDEIPLHPRIPPRIRPPELPGSGEVRARGKYGSSLYDLFMLSETMPREEMLRMTGGG